MIVSTQPTLLSDTAFSACFSGENRAISSPFADYFRAITLVIGGSEKGTRHNVCYKSLTINHLGTMVSGNPCPLVTDREENKGGCSEVTPEMFKISSLERSLHYLCSRPHIIFHMSHRKTNTDRTTNQIDLGFALWLIRTAKGYTMRECATRLPERAYRQSWSRWEQSKGGHHPYWRVLQLAGALQVSPRSLVSIACARVTKDL